MQAREGVLDLLNQGLTIELTAINQYFANAKMAANWGLGRLAHEFREFSMGEMRDAETLMDRILHLEGVPNMQRLSPVRIGETVPEQLEAGLEMERRTVNDFLVSAIQHCERVGDFTTRSLFQEMARDEEEHIAWFETQLELIRLLGLERYLSQQLESD